MNSRVYQHRSNAANETRFSHIDTHGHARSPQFVSPMQGNQSDARNGDTATLASSSSASTSSSSAARNNAAFETSDAASTTSSYNASFIVQQQQQHHQYQYHGRAQQQQRRASPSLQSLSSLSCSEDSSCTGLMMLYANTSVNTSNVTVTPSTAREQMYRNTHPFVSLEADSKHRGYMNINATNATPTRTNRTTTTPSALPEVPVLLDTFQHNSNSKYNCIPPKSIIAPSFTRHEKNTTKSNSNGNGNGNGNGNALSDLLLEMSSSSWDSSATSSNSAIANANSGANNYSNHDHDTLSVASGLVSLKMNSKSVNIEHYRAASHGYDHQDANNYPGYQRTTHGNAREISTHEKLHQGPSIVKNNDSSAASFPQHIVATPRRKASHVTTRNDITIANVHGTIDSHSHTAILMLLVEHLHLAVSLSKSAVWLDMERITSLLS